MKKCGHCDKALETEATEPEGWFLVHGNTHRPGFFYWKAMEQKLYRAIITPEQADLHRLPTEVYCSVRCLVLHTDKPCDGPRCLCKDEGAPVRCQCLVPPSKRGRRKKDK